MSLGTILLIILILILVGALPTWPHSQAWGYGPLGIRDRHVKISLFFNQIKAFCVFL